MSEHDPSAGPSDADSKRKQRRVGLRLLRRLIAYHAILVACMLVAVAAFPDFVRELPIGGVSELIEGGELTVGKPEQAGGLGGTDHSVLSASGSLDRLGYARQLSIVLVGTWLLMLPISWVHKCIHRASVHDHSLDETVLILPGIVAGIVLVVQHSLALAFSLAGIVAGVQFRRALQDTFDTLFILVAIGTGIAAGVRALEIAAVLTVFFTYSTLFVHYFGDGLESDFLARKRLEKKHRKQVSDTSDADDSD
jgi:hypothetical protein